MARKKSDGNKNNPFTKNDGNKNKPLTQKMDKCSFKNIANRFLKIRWKQKPKLGVTCQSYFHGNKLQTEKLISAQYHD